jgi:hypothetical protein
MFLRNDEMEVDADVEPDHLRIPEDPPDVFEENIFPNPFAHLRHGYFYRRGSALIIAGLPGIGLLCRSVSSPFFNRTYDRQNTFLVRHILPSRSRQASDSVHAIQ